MNLSDARALRDEIRAHQMHCVVPLGYGPDGYFARIFADKPIDFHTRTEARKYIAASRRRARKALREYSDSLRKRLRARSPIDKMIDNACGLP